MWWSYLLAAVGIVGLLLAGQKRTVGWAVGFGAQALWIAYAIATGQWGFIASAIAYGVVYARNWAKWRRDERGVTTVQLTNIDPPPSTTVATPTRYRYR